MKTYEWGSREYEQYIADLTVATAVQNRRNRYTSAKRKGRSNPFATIPRKPTSEELAVIEADRQWKAELKDKSDQWWFKRIDKAIEIEFYRARVYGLVWWEMCERQKLDYAEWHRRMDEGYDFDKALFEDLDLLEYALHCCGFPPAKARQMVLDAKDRKKWREQRQKVYECGCGEIVTDCSYAPTSCPSCGDKTSITERKQP